jgi:hypothetical protein
MKPLVPQSLMSRRSMFVRAAAVAACYGLLPKPLRADTRFHTFALFTPLVSEYLEVEGDVEVESQSGRKTKSTFIVRLSNLDLPAKTKLYVFWHSAIFNTLTALGSMKVDKDGNASGKFSVKRLVIATDVVYVSEIPDPESVSDFVLDATLEEVS